MFRNVARKGMGWFNTNMKKEAPTSLETTKNSRSEIISDLEKEEDFERFVNRICDVVSMGEIKEFPSFRKKFEEDFPENLEIIELIFELGPSLFIQKNLEEHTHKFEFSRSTFRDLTEYQFLLTHFIQNSDEDTLKKFWKIANIIAVRYGTGCQLDHWKRGALGQVGVIKILEELGFSPHLSHPDQDAFEKTDLWIENIRVQIKGNKDVSEPALVLSDETIFPGVKVGELESEFYYNSHFAHEAALFKATIEKINPKAKGVMLIIPLKMINSITGEPTKELVDFFRGKLTALGIIPEKK